MASTQIKTISAIQNTQSLKNISIIMERLTHTHQHNISNTVNWCTSWKARCRPGRIAQFTCKVQHLRHNLPSTQMPIESHLPRSTECTTESTSGLTRNTPSRTCTTLPIRRIEHQHRLHEFTIRQLKQDLPCPVIL